MRTEGAMPRRLPMYCVEDPDRHGNMRIYLKRRGHLKVRLRGTPWTPDFMVAYEAALAGRTLPSAASGADAETVRVAGGHAKRGTWGWLVREYAMSTTFRVKLDPRTQRVRLSILEATCREPLKPGGDVLFRDLPLSAMTPKHVRVLRDRKAATPAAADNRIKSVRQALAYAVQEDILTHNPAQSVSFFSKVTEGFHTWSVAEVRAYQKRHPLGTKARLALELLLYLGVRRSDLVALGPQHMVADDWISFVPHKTRRTNPEPLELPVLPALQAVIAASPIGKTTFLVTEFGKPYTSNGFGNWMRKRCDEAGLPQCSSHGLRKAGAALAAENGATTQQLMAIYNWKGIKEAERYTARARRKKMAADAMHFIDLGAEIDDS